MEIENNMSVNFNKIEVPKKNLVLAYQIPLQEYGTQEFVLSKDYYALASAYEKLLVAYELLRAKSCHANGDCCAKSEESK